MSFTIHLLTRQPFPAGLTLRATWDDPDDPTRRGSMGVHVGLSKELVRELSTAKLRAALGRDAVTSAGDRWLPQSRVFLHEGSEVARAVGEALLEALGGVMVLEGWVDDYTRSGDVWHLSESVPSVAPSPEQLRAIFKATVAREKKSLKRAAAERRERQRDEMRREREAAMVALAAKLEAAAAGDAEETPAVVLANDHDRALHDAVRGFLGSETPLLLGLARHREHGVERGLAVCVTATRLLLVPVDVPTTPPHHRFASPITVKARPNAKPRYEAPLRELWGVTFHAPWSRDGALMLSVSTLMFDMPDTSPSRFASDPTDPLTNQKTFRDLLPTVLVRGGAKWRVA